MKTFFELGLVLAFSFSIPFSCNKTVDAKDTELRSNKLLYLKGSTKPLNGKVMEYHDDKKEKIRSQRAYKQGRLSGTSSFWFKSGKPEAVRNYLDGNLHGTVEEWHEGGLQMKKRETWANGKRHGEWQTWKEDGKPNQAGLCENGEDVEVYDFYKDGSKHLRYRKPGYEPKD